MFMEGLDWSYPCPIDVKYPTPPPLLGGKKQIRRYYILYREAYTLYREAYTMYREAYTLYREAYTM